MESEPAIFHSDVSAVLRRRPTWAQHRRSCRAIRTRSATRIDGDPRCRTAPALRRCASCRFVARIVERALPACPATVAPLAPVPLTDDAPAQARRSSKRSPSNSDRAISARQNTDASVTAASPRRPPLALDKSVKKYLPRDLPDRRSISSAPRTPNAVTDEAITAPCAMRRRIPAFKQSDGLRSAGGRCSPTRCASRCSRTGSA